MTKTRFWKLILEAYDLSLDVDFQIEVDENGILRLTFNGKSFKFSLAELENALVLAHDFIESEDKWKQNSLKYEMLAHELLYCAH